jgi:hypothetical protein
MKATNIIPHKTYAILGENNNLVRFRVSAVVVRRVNAHNNPHDYKSLIEGRIDRNDIGGVPEDENVPLITVKPDQVLGLYDEYAELAARAAAERTARENEKARIKAIAESLWSKLYEVVDRPRPNDSGDYDLFQVSHYGVEISQRGVELLLAYFNKEKHS